MNDCESRTKLGTIKEDFTAYFHSIIYNMCQVCCDISHNTDGECYYWRHKIL